MKILVIIKVYTAKGRSWALQTRKKRFHTKTHKLLPAGYKNKQTEFKLSCFCFSQKIRHNFRTGQFIMGVRWVKKNPLSGTTQEKTSCCKTLTLGMICFYRHWTHMKDSYKPRILYADSKISDQTAHKRSLIRAFAVRICLKPQWRTARFIEKHLRLLEMQQF